MRVVAICLAVWALSASSAAWAAESDARYAQDGESEAGMTQWLKRLGRVRLPGEHERGHATVTSAFRDVAAVAAPSTVRVLCEGQQAALGVVVRADGLILTKASELSGKLECILADGSRLPAHQVARRDDCDLTLLRVARQNLPVVRWSRETEVPVGSWLVTANLDPQPVVIGVVSAPPQESPAPRAVLGVRMNRVDQGVRINLVMPGTGAARAGMRAGDVIAAINGRTAESPETITDLIREMQPGDTVKLSVLRETTSLSVTATLGDMSRLGGMEQAELMDSLGGPLSRRRAGFPSVIQHDSVLRPRECGGPVVDLDGNAVGINIARVSRVATYALPASVAQQAVQEMLQDLSRPTLVTETPVATQTP